MVPNFGAILVWLAGGFQREEGQALAEYSLILAFIAAACILAVGALGVAVSGQLDGITAALP